MCEISKFTEIIIKSLRCISRYIVIIVVFFPKPEKISTTKCTSKKLVLSYVKNKPKIT